MLRNFDEVLEAAKTKRHKKICVAAAQDEDVLKVVVQAHRLGLASPILIGDKEKMLRTAEELHTDITGFEIIKENDPIKSARLAVDMVGGGQADILMKGMLQTADIMRAVLDRETGLRGNGLLSHVGILEVPGYDRLILMSDGGLNIAPDLQKKAAILQNAVNIAIALGNRKPNAAILSALEFVNPDIPSTLDAAALCKMADRGQIKNCTVDGPLALDNAISLVAAQHKGLNTPIAGQTDVFIVPNMEAGNILYKSLVFLAGAKSAGIIAGARVPMVVTSRADSFASKLNSIAVSMLIDG